MIYFYDGFITIRKRLVINCEFIQFALQKIMQNKLKKLFKTNVIITFNKITKTKA